MQRATYTGVLPSDGLSYVIFDPIFGDEEKRRMGEKGRSEVYPGARINIKV